MSSLRYAVCCGPQARDVGLAPRMPGMPPAHPHPHALAAQRAGPHLQALARAHATPTTRRPLDPLLDECMVGSHMSIQRSAAHGGARRSAVQGLPHIHLHACMDGWVNGAGSYSPIHPACLDANAMLGIRIGLYQID